VSRSIGLLARSVAFNALFYVNMIVHMIVALPTIVLPYRVFLAILRSYARTSLLLLRVICGTGVEWRRIENIPKGPCLIACKHQSAWETFALYAVLQDPTFVLKRELMWLPLFGWLAHKARMIPIDRGAGAKALAGMTARAREELAQSRQVVIFPEGTRRPPGAAADYRPGIVRLYERCGVACVPLALNSGLFWPRRSLLRLPGTIVVEALEPIAPGLDRRAFLDRLQGVLEAATDRLVAEGREIRDR
jgi:1-acyl-sn-glycerol-3-phosphate acyltransferase